jgi:hypothetical protein
VSLASQLYLTQQKAAGSLSVHSLVPIRLLDPDPKARGRIWRLRELIYVPEELRGCADTFAPDGGFCIVEETIPPEEKEQFMITAEMLKEEGRQVGHLTALREAVLDLLETRFTEIPAVLRESVLRLNDLNHLRQLVRRAGLCASLEDFSAEL